MNYINLPEHLRKRLLLMQGTRMVDPIASTKILQAYENPSPLPTHDWGIFGEFQYLGAGTPYRQKMAAGVEPTNDLDRIAMYHDGQYSWSGEHLRGATRNVFRGGMDYGAGSAMQVAALNPWSDLTAGERALAFVAGTALTLQGVLRLNPVFWLPGSIADIIIY